MTTPSHPPVPSACDGAVSTPATPAKLTRRSLLRGLTVAATPLVMSSLTGCGGANAGQDTSDNHLTPGSPPPENASPVEIGTAPYTVALLGKLASASYDLREAVDNFIAHMRQAKANGATMIVAGELYLPGYPNDINYTSDWATRGWPTYKRNSMTVGDAQWNRIIEAAQTLDIAVNFGFSEKDGDLYYMSQVLVGNDGSIWNQRRKVRPSGAERQFWSDAPMAGNLQVTTTPLGRISMLMCWDHLRPQSTFNVMAQLPNVHVCAWPLTGVTTDATPFWDRQEVAHTAAAYFSQLTGAETLLVSYGYCAVYKWSVKVAELLPNDPQPMLYHTITPSQWTGASESVSSEFSYGVLSLLQTHYPGQKAMDPEHGVLHLNPQSS